MQFPRKLYLYIDDRLIRSYILPREKSFTQMWEEIHKAKIEYQLKGKNFKFFLNIESKLQ